MNEIIALCDGVKDYHNQRINETMLRFIRTREQDFAKESPEEPKVTWLKQHKMDLMDGFYIMAYTGSASGWLNSEKRNGQDYQCACKAAFAQGLETALLKIEQFNGTVFRMEECDGEGIQAEWFQANIGKSIRLPYFLSTATDDYNNSPMVWVIRTCAESNGRDISKIANAPGENEVLFNRDSKFVITGADLGNPDKVIIYMDELPADSLTEMDLCGVYYR